MDKYEYKVKAEEIKELIAKRDYAQAAEIADSIDWRRVKSVMMLCTISDLYKINRRYEDARDILLLAYERRPGGRNICYSLCELSIKTGEFVQAMEYYKEFVQVAPKDPGRYILQYKLYVDQDVSLEERIAVLEELKKRDYREKWAYELAYLYHRVGLATQCVQECDEIILWFGEGEYVTKAMELKMLHQPLTSEQQEKYDRRFVEKTEEEAPDAEKDGQDESREIPVGDTQIYEPVRPEDVPAVQESDEEYSYPMEEEPEDSEVFYEESEDDYEGDDGDGPAAEESVKEPEEMDIQVKTMDMGQYNTINLQAELAQNLQDLLSDEEDKTSVVASIMDSDTESLDHLEIDEVSEDDLEPEPEEMEGSEVFFGETGEIDFEQVLQPPVTVEEHPSGGAIARTIYPDRSAESRMAEVQPPKELENVLSQESDGQISLVIPDSTNVEKQITGQMNIQDVLAEWERMKKENEEKRKEEVRQHVLQQTGNMFTEFDAAVRDGLLEQLEKSADEQTSDDTADEPEEVMDAGEDVREFVMLDEKAAEAGADTAPKDDEGNVPQTDIEEPEEKPQEESDVEEEPESKPGLEEDGSGEETEEKETDSHEKSKTRSMTPEERELYANYIQSRSAKEQIVRAVDNISLAAYTGNVIITGETGMDTISLAKNMIREVQAADSNFSGKVAKISGQGLNHKNVEETLNQLQNGALIIQHAADLDEKTVQDLYKALQKESLGIVVLLEDETKTMNHFLQGNEKLLDVFTARVDVEALSNDVLVAYGKQYARNKEYSIDELGVLALHNRIEERQTLDHAVTTSEIRQIVDEAIRRADRKTLRHFFDILFSKRYDEEDMIVVTEKDFI